MPLSASILLFINLFRSVRLPIFFVSQVVLTACYFCFAAFLTCFSPVIIEYPHSVRRQRHYSLLSCPRYASFLQASFPGSSFPQISHLQISSPQASSPQVSLPQTSFPRASSFGTLPLRSLTFGLLLSHRCPMLIRLFCRGTCRLVSALR